MKTTVTLNDGTIVETTGTVRIGPQGLSVRGFGVDGIFDADTNTVAEAPKPSDPDIVFTLEELRAIASACRCVSGLPETTWRGVTDSVFNKIEARYPEMANAPTVFNGSEIGALLK